ncbi:transposase [Rhodovulum sulfidophilum]|uniref:Transposase n=1 Tax=Rhodovulum sulfidophilum TaxID=35806 RepID=A0ABS1RYW6_RHOSU|nr:transposase [Rhodovulum sulfidophilum]
MFSDAAIQFSFMMKVLFGLPRRQTMGMSSRWQGWTGRSPTSRP